MRRIGLYGAFAGLALLGAPRADACRALRVDFTPVDDLQVVVWLEDASGQFVATMFVTEATGTYGIGNRPGRMDFNSEWAWPYGRRETVFPVWAHRHGVLYPRVVFQNGDDDNLSHPAAESTTDSYFCRPLDPDDTRDRNMIDAQTCSTPVFTEKGQFERDGDGEIAGWSLYPPRSDVRQREGDHDDVAGMSGLNDLDALSRATPPGYVPYSFIWLAPPDVLDGDYLVHVEVAREFDQNAFHDYPSPIIPWETYGRPYRGQPSVVWSVPVTIDEADRSASTLDYDGYGDPDGLSGQLFAPDGTITTGVEGSGAGRLIDAGGWRVRVDTIVTNDDVAPPAATSSLDILDVTASTITGRFRSPGDDGLDGPVAGYEIRYAPGVTLTAENFTGDGTLLEPSPPGGSPGQDVDFTLAELTPSTRYSIGVRAFDECLNRGALAFVSVDTPRAPGGEVGVCAIATGARPPAAGGWTVGAITLLLAAALRRRTHTRSHLPRAPGSA